MDEVLLQRMGQPSWAFLCVTARLMPLMVMIPPIRGVAVPQRFRVGFAMLLFRRDDVEKETAIIELEGEESDESTV